MKLLSLLFVLICACLAQDPLGTGLPPNHPSVSETDAKIAKIQRDALIKSDHKKNVDDATALWKLAEELKADIEKQDANVVSVRNIKQVEDIEKLAKNIHGRLNRY